MVPKFRKGQQSKTRVRKIFYSPRSLITEEDYMRRSKLKSQSVAKQGLPKCQAFEALGFLLELQNCREDGIAEICKVCTVHTVLYPSYR